MSLGGAHERERNPYPYSEEGSPIGPSSWYHLGVSYRLSPSIFSITWNRSQANEEECLLCGFNLVQFQQTNLFVSHSKKKVTVWVSSLGGLQGRDLAWGLGLNLGGHSEGLIWGSSLSVQSGGL